MHKISLVAIALLGLAFVPAVSASGPTDPVPFCVHDYGVTAYNYDCEGGDLVVVNACALSNPESGTGVCYRHTYQPTKNADCKGVLANVGGVSAYYVECQGDANCYDYTDFRVDNEVLEYGCYVLPGAATVFPYLP